MSLSILFIATALMNIAIDVKNLIDRESKLQLMVEAINGCKAIMGCNFLTLGNFLLKKI